MPDLTPAEQAAAWNADHPVGTVVDYWPGARIGLPRRGATIASATVLGGHTAVTWVDTASGCIGLSHVRPIEFKETAEDLNTRPDVQDALNPAEMAAAVELSRIYNRRVDIPQESEPADHADEARAVAEAVEPHHTIAALDEVEDALGHLAGFNESAQSAEWLDGVTTARRIISEQAAALRSDLEGTTTHA